VSRLGWILPGVLVVVAVSVGTSITARRIAPQSLDRLAAGFNREANGKATLEILGYHTGYLESRALSRITSPSLPHTYLVEHAIDHAPWTQLRRAAFIHVTSRVWSEEKGDASDSPVGGLETRILPHRAYIDFWLATPARAILPRKLTWGELTGSFEGNETDAHVELHLVDLKLDGGATRADRMYVRAEAELQGERFKLTSFASRAEGVAGKDLQSKVFAIDLKHRPHGELRDFDVLVSGEELKDSTGTVDEMALDVTLENVSNDIGQILFVSGPHTDPAVLAALPAKLAAHPPSLVIHDLRFKAHLRELNDMHVDLSIQGRVDVDSVPRSGAASMQALLGGLRADLDVRIGESFLIDSMGSPLAEHGIQDRDPRQMLQALVQTGYFTRDGEYLQTRVSTRSNKVLLNGLEFGPVMHQFASILNGRLQTRRATPPRRMSQAPGNAVPLDGPSNSQLDEMRRQMGLE